jgi:hypothetical protein
MAFNFTMYGSPVGIGNDSGGGTLGAPSKRNDPRSKGGKVTATTFDRSATDVTAVVNRPFPALDEEADAIPSSRHVVGHRSPEMARIAPPILIAGEDRREGPIAHRPSLPHLHEARGVAILHDGADGELHVVGAVLRVEREFPRLGQGPIEGERQPSVEVHVDAGDRDGDRPVGNGRGGDALDGVEIDLVSHAKILCQRADELVDSPVS